MGICASRSMIRKIKELDKKLADGCIVVTQLLKNKNGDGKDIYECTVIENT